MQIVATILLIIVGVLVTYIDFKSKHGLFAEEVKPEEDWVKYEIH